MSMIPDQRRFIAVDPNDHSMSLETGPVPSPRPGEVLIKVSAAGDAANLEEMDEVMTVDSYAFLPRAFRPIYEAAPQFDHPPVWAGFDTGWLL